MIGDERARENLNYFVWLERQAHLLPTHFPARPITSPAKTNVEMHDAIEAAKSARRDLIERVGCCGCRSQWGICKLDYFRCRVVAAAMRLLERT